MLAAGVTPAFAVVNDWNSGYQAEIRLDNYQAASVANWKLEFDLPANITSIWDGQIASHVGNHYAIVGAAWDSTLAAGGSVAFGFVASPGGKPPAPTNYVLNGIRLDGTKPAPPPPPGLSIDDVAILEGASGTTAALFTVSLSSPAAGPVSVRYATTAATAQAGSDYQSTSGTLMFAAGETKKTISVAVLGDTLVEPDEVFYVNLSTASGALVTIDRGTGTIRNDDVAPPVSGNFQFQVISDWGSGFTGAITVRNASAAAVTNWQLEFDFAGNITSIWDAKIVNHTGSHYVLENAGYNSTLAAGGAVSFGFVASPGNVTVSPANYVLKSAGTTGGGGPPPPNQAPTAGGDQAYALPGQAVTINVLANDKDADGDALSVAAVAQAAHGAVMLKADYTIVYTPQAGFVGNDSFTYQLRDARGATSTGTVAVTVAAASTWPAHVFAPYVDMTLYPMYDLVAAAQSQGLRYFTLAFVVADSRNQPAWGGYTEYELGTAFDAQMKSQLAGIRALGGDAIVSFGGAAGRELAQAITDVAALKRAYQSVIDAYGFTHIDFDIEGAAVADRASIDRRNQAIAGLQRDAAAAGRVLDVSYTLPVLPSGLTSDGLYVLQSALRYGVNLGLVNVMAMDYGDSAAPNPKGHMGDYAIDAANSLFAQLKGLYGAAKTDAQVWQMVGVTPMIGLNDVTTETFDQQEARELLAFAQQKGIGRIAFWSLNRDRQSPSGALGWVDNMASSLLQQPYEFSQILKPITG